jgi:hypothetical protein
MKGDPPGAAGQRVLAYERADPSPLAVLAVDDALPADPVVLEYWLANLRHPARLTLLHLCRLIATVILCLVYFVKRLLPFQFSAHRLLQATICWFMEWWVAPEANVLILRHFWAESNVINFIIANSHNKDAQPAALYPETIRDLMAMSFLLHDIVLLNALYDLGPTQHEAWPVPRDDLDFSTMREVKLDYDSSQRRWTQVLDFETAHELFKTLFCVLVRADEYERSINSLNFDQTLALRVSRIVGESWVATMAVNVMPLYFIGPLNISRRFVMHGLFTEHLHAYLERLRERPRTPAT